MTGKDIIELIGFDRAISTSSDIDKISESQSIVLSIAKEFGIDSVYFNTEENNNSYPSVFLKKVNSFDNDTLIRISKIQQNLWNYKKVLFLYVYSDTEIRIYNCSEKPILKTQKKFNYAEKLQKLELKSYNLSDKEQIEELNRFFSRIAIDTGIIWTLEEAYSIRKKINIQQRVDKYLVTSLVNTAEKLKAQGLNINFIHKIILRSLFLLYLEDRGATDAKFYSNIKEGASSYFEILEDVDSTYKLYKELEERFNGNVFFIEDGEIITREQLQLIKKCFISGDDNSPQMDIFEGWRLFNFSIIQIELLSEIYENFLFRTFPDLKKSTGTYYTPPSLVEFILNEKLPINDSNYNVKIIDPACGSGIFLVESFKRLVKRYEYCHKKKLTDFKKLKDLLTDNIFGVELHPQAIKVAAFSLYLALVDNLDPKTLWQYKKLPNLINNPNDTSLKEQGKNLFCRDTILKNEEIENTEYDLVIGNPPFGTSISLASIRDYCDKYHFAKEMVLPFLHKATKISPNGEIALIFNTKVLTNTGGTYQNFRKWLFNECYVEKIYNFSILRKAPKDFGGKLFGDAVGPISIVYYKNNIPENISDKITYYAPKTYVKSNFTDGLVIDQTDVKYLPREECQKSDSKIWKVAMWGGMNDFALLNKLEKANYNSIKEYTEKNYIKSGVGFQLLTQKKDKPKYNNILSNLQYLDASLITKYYTNNELLDNIKTSIKSSKAIKFYKEFYSLDDLKKLEKLTGFRRLGDIDAFLKPHIILKKGLEHNSICASFIENQCSFRDGVYGFYSEKEQIEKLYVLLSYFNSKLSTYFLFMTISSYGIEREQIMKNEYLSIPINLKEEQSHKICNATKNILLNLKSQNILENSFLNNDIDKLITQDIDNTIYKSLELEDKDVCLLNDCITYNIDLFHKQEKSIALYPVLDGQTKKYGQLICSELNDFLDGQNLFANATVYNINRFTPLMIIKISFSSKQSNVSTSKDLLDKKLKEIDQHLWEEKASNIYFRKKLNYKTGNDIFIIRPNQRRFWSESMALEDASELILELLTEN